MGLITGRYLEGTDYRELVLWEPKGSPPSVDWPEALPDAGTTEDMERLMLCLLRRMDGPGVPLSVACVELGDRYCPLSREAVSDLSDEAQDKVLCYPTQLILVRLIRDEDEEVLPESLAEKLLALAGIQRPHSPFTLSFRDAAAVVLELLPG